MTEYIGDVPVASIQNISLSRTEETSEIDVVGKDTNIVIHGSVEGHEIQIDFTLVQQLHPNNKTVEEQKNEIKKVVRRSYTNNDFDYGNLINGFLLLNDISLPESSDSDTIISGSVSGFYLPYPKFN